LFHNLIKNRNIFCRPYCTSIIHGSADGCRDKPS